MLGGQSRSTSSEWLVEFRTRYIDKIARICRVSNQGTYELLLGRAFLKKIQPFAEMDGDRAQCQ
jgi:hypothetical protein